MITISSEQIDGLKAGAAQGYVDRVVAQLNIRFPEQTNQLGLKKTRIATESVLERARAYGLESEYDLFLYACLAFALGLNFDSDPKLPWVQATLNSRLLGSRSERLERTYELAMAATSQSGQPWVPMPAVTQ
jgi:hypothetical protein